jgi:putative dehydrogenase
MVGGADAAFERARPLFEALAANVFRVGSQPGLGATMKLVNNLLAGIYLAAGAEAMAIGTAAGLDGRTMAQVFAASSGQSWIVVDRLARLLAEDPNAHAQMQILAKDLRLGLELVQRLGQSATLGTAASTMFQAAIDAGLATADDSTLIKWRMQST